MAKNIQISMVTARLKDNGELIWAEGIEDCYSVVQPIIPLSAFSLNEINSMGVSESPSHLANIRQNTGSDHVNLGENEAKDIYPEFDRFTIQVEEVSVK